MIPRRIVVATDGSPAARQAEVFGADQAALMAQSGPVEVVVLTATHDVGHLSELGGTIPPSREAHDAEQFSEAGRQHIVGLLEGRDPGANIRVQAKVVPALTLSGAVIAEAHATGTCSLIVLGNRGHGGVSEALLGSVSLDVVHRAHCPVVIVRD
jgi:nucleotide-binding universal stress UspA family protein